MTRIKVEDIIRYESGDMTDEEVVPFFQSLIDSGAAWTLQGHYGRVAMQFINAGLCSVSNNGLQQGVRHV